MELGNDGKGGGCMNISKELLIILIIALLLFGSTRLAGLGSALGKSIRDFQKALEGHDEEKAAPPPATDPTKR